MLVPGREIPAHRLSPLIGRARVKWIRKVDDAEFPKGIGVEFVELDPETLQLLNSFLEQTHPKAYIPKI